MNLLFTRAKTESGKPGCLQGARLEQGKKHIIGLTTTSHFLVHLFEGVLPPLISLLIMEFST